MQRVLINIPVLQAFFGPDGIPVYGFGFMLFLTFITAYQWGRVRAKKIGMESERFLDFIIWVFLAGIIGARTLYMIQYANQFDASLLGIIGSFFKIWEGGIIFYGSTVGGALGYGLFYWFVMRRMNISGWQLADVVAPLLAMGLALGRIGCFLNGCCWGQVACEPVTQLPVGAVHFPLLAAHARTQLVSEQYVETATGFTLRSRDAAGLEDPREVTAVERDSAAAAAGLKPGDRIVGVNGQPNDVVVDLFGNSEQIGRAVEEMKKAGGRVTAPEAGHARVGFSSVAELSRGEDAGRRASPEVRFYPADTPLEEMTKGWPRDNRLALELERDGKVEKLATFTPRTVGLYPTQLYETISMVLLIFLLLAYYPFRRHDGELMVILMVGYAVHRFINESLRIEPTVGLGLTLSQWGSVVIFAGAVGMEIFLWVMAPSRWKDNGGMGEQPPSTPAAQPAAAPVA